MAQLLTSKLLTAAALGICIFANAGYAAESVSSKNLKTLIVVADSNVWAARVDKKDGFGDSEFVIRHKKIAACEITVLESWGKPSTHKEDWENFSRVFKSVSQSFAEVPSPSSFVAPKTFECNTFEGSVREKVANNTSAFCTKAIPKPSGTVTLTIEMTKAASDRAVCIADTNTALAAFKTQP